MKLNTQQKTTVTAIALLFLVAIGASVFIHSAPEESRTRMFALSTSTPTQDPSSSGWWDAIPTNPPLPARWVEPVETMPIGSSSTMTPSTP